MDASDLDPNNIVFMGSVTAKEIEIRWRLRKMEKENSEKMKSTSLTDGKERTCYEMLTGRDSIIKHIDDDSTESIMVDSFDMGQSPGSLDTTMNIKMERDESIVQEDFEKKIHSLGPDAQAALKRTIQSVEGFKATEDAMKAMKLEPEIKMERDESTVQEDFEKKIDSLGSDIQAAVNRTIRAIEGEDNNGMGIVEDSSIEESVEQDQTLELPKDEAGCSELLKDRVVTELPNDGVEVESPKDEAKIEFPKDEVGTGLPEDEVKAELSKDEVEVELPKTEDPAGLAIPSIKITDASFEFCEESFLNVTVRKSSPKGSSFKDLSSGKLPTPKVLKSLKRDMGYRNSRVTESPMRSPIKLKTTKTPLLPPTKKVAIKPAKLTLSHDSPNRNQGALKMCLRKPVVPPKTPQSKPSTPDAPKLKTPTSKIPVKPKTPQSDLKSKLPLSAGAIPKTTPKLAPSSKLPQALSKVSPSRLNHFPFAVDEKSSIPRVITGMKPPTPVKPIYMRPVTPTSLKQITSPIRHYIRNSPTTIMRSDKIVTSASVEDISQQKENVNDTNLPQVELKKVVYVSNEDVEISEELPLPSLGPRQKEVVMCSPKVAVVRHIAVKEEHPQVLPNPRDSIFPLGDQPRIEETSVLFTKQEAL